MIHYATGKLSFFPRQVALHSETGLKQLVWSHYKRNLTTQDWKKQLALWISAEMIHLFQGQLGIMTANINERLIMTLFTSTEHEKLFLMIAWSSPHSKEGELSRAVKRMWIESWTQAVSKSHTGRPEQEVHHCIPAPRSFSKHLLITIIRDRPVTWLSTSILVY